MSKCRFSRVPGKCLTRSKKNVRWGPGDVDFGPPGKCQKNVKMTVLGYPKWTVPKMSKILEKCQNLTKNVKIGWKMYIFQPILTFFVRFWHFSKIFDILGTVHFGYPKTVILTFFWHFPGGPKSTSPGPHLTFFFDRVRHFPGTLENRHFDIFLTFSSISGNTPVTLGSALYGFTPQNAGLSIGWLGFMECCMLWWFQRIQ